VFDVGTSVCRSNSVRVLGVTIDQHLTFDNHVARHSAIVTTIYAVCALFVNSSTKTLPIFWRAQLWAVGLIAATVCCMG
jgi:hypothetical protein